MKRLCGRTASVIASVLFLISLAPPVEGNSVFTLDWMGARWRFANAANRDAFAKDPTRYAPQYGGYCAWAVSQGSTASTTPEAWKIVGG